MHRRYGDSTSQDVSSIRISLSQMRQPLAIALCVSPVALLISGTCGYLNRIPLLELLQVRLQKKIGMSILELFPYFFLLFQLSINFGNDGRPRALRILEASVWSAIYNIALGAESEAELESLVASWEIISSDERLQLNSVESLGWFAQITGL